MPSFPGPPPIRWARLFPASSSTRTLFFIALLVGLAAALMRLSVALALAALVTIVLIAGWRDRHRLARLAAERPPEGLGSFARDPDIRHANTWVIRAVYEGLQQELAAKGVKPFAIRGTDLLIRTLQLDGDELSLFTIPGMVLRAGRELPDSKDPSWGSVRTVADLVRFLDRLPRLTQNRG